MIKYLVDSNGSPITYFMPSGGRNSLSRRMTGAEDDRGGVIGGNKKI